MKNKKNEAKKKAIERKILREKANCENVEMEFAVRREKKLLRENNK